MLILIDEASGLALNPADISTLCRSELRGRRAYMGGEREKLQVLTIRMRTGEQLVIDDSQADLAALHKRLMEAQ